MQTHFKELKFLVQPAPENFEECKAGVTREVISLHLHSIKPILKGADMPGGICALHFAEASDVADGFL